MALSNRLQSFTVFFNELACEDESATDVECMEKILFYHPSNDDARTKLNHVSLCEGLIGFAKTVGNGEAIESVHMESSRHCFCEVEPNVWMVMTLRDGGVWGRADDTAVTALMQRIYESLTLFHGSIRGMFLDSLRIPMNSDTEEIQEMSGLELVLKIQQLRKKIRKINQISDDKYSNLSVEDQASAKETDQNNLEVHSKELEFYLMYSPGDKARQQLGYLLGSYLLPSLRLDCLDFRADFIGHQLSPSSPSSFLAAKSICHSVTMLGNGLNCSVKGSCILINGQMLYSSFTDEFSCLLLTQHVKYCISGSIQRQQQGEKLGNASPASPTSPNVRRSAKTNSVRRGRSRSRSPVRFISDAMKAQGITSADGGGGSGGGGINSQSDSSSDRRRSSGLQVDNSIPLSGFYGSGNTLIDFSTLPPQPPLTTHASSSTSSPILKSGSDGFMQNEWLIIHHNNSESSNTSSADKLWCPIIYKPKKAKAFKKYDNVDMKSPDKVVFSDKTMWSTLGGSTMLAAERRERGGGGEEGGGFENLQEEDNRVKTVPVALEVDDDAFSGLDVLSDDQEYESQFGHGSDEVSFHEEEVEISDEVLGRLLVYAQGPCTMIVLIGMKKDMEQRGKGDNENKESNIRSMMSDTVSDTNSLTIPSKPSQPAHHQEEAARAIMTLCGKIQSSCDEAILSKLVKPHSYLRDPTCSDGVRFLYYNAACYSSMGMLSSSDITSFPSVLPNGEAAGVTSNTSRESRRLSSQSRSSLTATSSSMAASYWKDSIHDVTAKLSPNLVRAVSHMHTSLQKNRQTCPHMPSTMVLHLTTFSEKGSSKRSSKEGLGSEGSTMVAHDMSPHREGGGGGSFQEVSNLIPNSSDSKKKFQVSNDWLIGESFGDREIFVHLDSRFVTLTSALEELAHIKTTLLSSILLK